jgi:outer membrane protein assembly factor BamB
LRSVEAIPGQQPERGPAVSGVTVSIQDGLSATRSTVLWTGKTDERGEALWPGPATPAAPAAANKRLYLHAAKGGYQSTARPIDPAAGEEIIALSKWMPWVVEVFDADSKKPLETFQVMNRMATNLSTHYGPVTGQAGTAIAGYFSEKTIRLRQLTIEADGYETLQKDILPVLGQTNTFGLKRKPAAP